MGMLAIIQKKSNYMKIKLLLLGLLFTAELANAQTDFRSGYVINLNKDTLIGEIDYRGDILMGEVCRFRVNETGKEVKYSPSDIIAYRFNEGKYFVSKELNGKNIFLEFLIKGQINIYYHRDVTGDHYFLEKEGTKIIELPYEEGVKYENDVPYFYSSTQHIGILNYYMQDAPEFQSRIYKMGKPEHYTLIKLAEDYHHKVCKDGECIIYEKKIPLLIFNIEIIGGIVKYQNTDYNNDKNYFQAGILMHACMQRLNEKLYIRTGILYSTLEANNVKEAVYKIPFQIEYIYPKGIVRPSVALGINLYSQFNQSVALTGGVSVKVDNSLYLRLNYDIDFIPNEKFALFPESILSQSILAGFLIKL